MRSVLMRPPHFGGRHLASKGDAVPLGYAPGSGETVGDNPLAPARQGRPRRGGAGSGIKVRQSWTLIGNFMRRTAVRLFCLFRRRRNAAEKSAAYARCAALYVQIVGHYRLETVLADCVIDLIDRAAVRNLELLVALLLTRMAADTDINACGNLGRGDADDVVAETGALARRNEIGRASCRERV